MSETFVTADLHLGHNNITAFRDFSSSEEHDEFVIKRYNETVSKKDRVFILGDVAFNLKGLEKVSRLNGTKVLILGNHDRLSLERYAPYFGRPRISHFRDNLLMTHIPIHKESLRGYTNVHGHVHNNSIRDHTYINVCLDVMDFRPIHIDTIKRIANYGVMDEKSCWSCHCFAYDNGTCWCLDKGLMTNLSSSLIDKGCKNFEPKQAEASNGKR